MSESPSRPRFDRSEDHAYFRAVEKLFIELRGAPFQLSPDDFDVVKEWRAGGVPLDVALGTIREIVERAIDEDADPKRRLSYYRRAVEKAWQRQRELAAPAAEAVAESLDIDARLGRLADAVPDRLPEIRRRLRGLRREAKGESAEAVDSALASIDAEMLEQVRSVLTDEELSDLERRTAASLQALSGRLGGGSDEARRRVEVRLLRDVAGLPLLSLFSPDALRPVAGDSAPTGDEEESVPG